MHKKLLIYKQKYCRLPVCKPYCYHEWGLSTLKRKNRPLCETPRSGYFCGPDKYLRLQEHTISEELFPVMEVDSYFVLVRSGSGSFIINGEEFPVQAGCVAWIQCSQVLTICPEFGETLTLWVAAFDYQLLSYYMFNQITNLREVEIVTGLPVIGPEGDDVRQIARQFEQFRHLSAKNSCGSAVIRSSFLRKIELLYNRAPARRKEQYSLLEMPLGRRASLYIATHSTAELTAASVAEAVSSDADETALNHALLIATGLNFSQYVNRVRLILAMSYFLYDSLPFDYVSSISGFHMSITFFRRFKALTGMTPQGYLNDMLSDGKDGRVYRGMILSETLISAISYLYENMSEPIDAEKIAHDLYTSENILRVQLKTRLNSSYKQILSMFRVRYAEALLTTTELPTVDIAMETGFGSDRTMGRVFYALNKMSQGEFRKQRGQGRKQHG